MMSENYSQIKGIRKETHFVPKHICLDGTSRYSGDRSLVIQTVAIYRKGIEKND